MRIVFSALALSVMLVGCVPDSAPSMHDLFVYGTLDARLSYIYGTPGEFVLDGTAVSLSEGKVDTPYAVAGSLLVNDRPFVRFAVAPLNPPPLQVSRIPLTTDLQVAVQQDVEAVFYFDGKDFFTLIDGAAANTVQRVVPRPRLNRLRGMGQLTNREADALAVALTADGTPFALAVLNEADLPPHSVDGLAEVLRSGVYVQSDIPTDVAAFKPGPQQVPWEAMASGTQAVGFDQQEFVLVTNTDRLVNLWNRAYGSQLQVPSVPDVDFERETVLAVYVGQKPTGGYSVSVRSVSIDGGDLYVDLVQNRPQAGSMTTQALTSPWLMVRVLRGGFGVAWIRDADTGSLLGVARRTR